MTRAHPQLTCKWLLAYCGAVADVFRALVGGGRRFESVRGSATAPQIALFGD
jgi:hypothetical protein